MDISLLFTRIIKDVIAVEITEFEPLNDFISVPVEVAIQDEEVTDNPLFVSKQIKSIGLCPDRTHLRIFFEKQTFFAIPLTSTVSFSADEWMAVDSQNHLKYVIRRVREV